MKKVLIINSTPRGGGNSEMLCGEFARGAKESGNKVEIVNLRECKIGFCVGCFSCALTGKCFQNDDMEIILGKMQDSDVIVLATPVYFYSMTAQLKIFIDRCTPKYEQLINKEFYYIITAADTSQTNCEKVIDAIRGFTLDCLNNPIEKGIIYGLGMGQDKMANQTATFVEAYKMGNQI